MPEIDVWMAAICIDNSFKSAIQVIVVAVYVPDDVASCELQTFIDRVRLATILFADPIGQMGFVLPNEINSPIRASTVDNDVFQIRISLAEHRGDRLLDKPRLIQGRCDDGNSWGLQQDASSKTNSMFQR